MARADLSDYLDFKHMPSGRDGFALTQTRGLVEDKLGSSSPLLPIIDDAIAQGREAVRIEFNWQAAKKRDEDASRGESLALKQQITRKLSNLFSILEGRSDGDDDVAVEAREIIATVFPNGVAGVSKQSFEDMLASLQTMLADHLDGPLAEAVTTAGVEREVQLLRGLTDRFARALVPLPCGQVSYDKVQVAQHALHEAVCEVIVEILHATAKRNFVPPEGSAPMTDADRVRLREELLAPLNFQQELVAEARARHTKPLDVNPDTGEVIDPDASVVTTGDGGTDPTDS